MGGSANDDEDEDSSSDTIFLLSGKKLWVYADKKAAIILSKCKLCWKTFLALRLEKVSSVFRTTRKKRYCMTRASLSTTSAQKS